jgi:uncharacterized protein involved in exopolysaccharide biosynthesis
MANASDEAQLDLLGYLSVLWNRKWLVLGLAGVTLVAALALSFSKPQEYVSSTKILVTPTALNPPGSVPLPNTISLATEADIVRSQPVASAAAGSLGGGVTASTVLADTSSDYSAASTQVMVISFRADDAAIAQRGAQAVAQAYLDNRSAQAAAAADAAVKQANEQIDSLQKEADAAAKTATRASDGSSAQIEASNQAAQINGQIAIWQSNLSVLNLQAVNPGEILVPAGLPTEPASPDHKKDASRAILLGLLIGIAAALFTDSLQRRAAAG